MNKITKIYERLGTVYFPAETYQKERQQWLRARGFRATEADVGFWRQLGNGRGVNAARLNAVTSQTSTPQRFKGEHLAAASKISADTVLAAYDLLWETFVAFGYHKRAAASYAPLREMTKPVMSFTHGRRGHATWGDHLGRRFSIPKHALNVSEEYAVYYVAHELAHHAFFGIDHGSTMEKVEGNLCAAFDIAIEYKTVYPRKLIRKSTGAVVYCRK